MNKFVLMWILWPSFLLAGVGSAIVFALVDPHDILVFNTLHFSREVVYAAGFFIFWLATSLSSALTLFMAPARSWVKKIEEEL